MKVGENVKGIYVMEKKPEKCGGCKFCFSPVSLLSQRCFITEKHIEDAEKLDGDCPFKPLPEKMAVCGKYPQQGPAPSYRVGWNDCLQAIHKTGAMKGKCLGECSITKGYTCCFECSETHIEECRDMGITCEAMERGERDKNNYKCCPEYEIGE